MEELTTAYYECRFRLRYVESKGDVFQDFFSTIMEMRYPADFVRVRPWGKLGDHKNDGYLASKRQLFQCYAPREMDMTTCKAKINADFAAALPFWKDHFDRWFFTHNDIDGLAADILNPLLDLSTKHAPVSAAQWGYGELRQEFKQLSEADIATLLGPAPGRKDVLDLRLEDVKRLLEHIALQPEPLAVDVRLVPADKLEYNQLSQATGTLLTAGMTRSEIVKISPGHCRSNQIRSHRRYVPIAYRELREQAWPQTIFSLGCRNSFPVTPYRAHLIKPQHLPFWRFSLRRARFSSVRRTDGYPIMILPTKGLALDRALLSVGAEVLRRLDRPKTVSRLWIKSGTVRVAF